MSKKEASDCNEKVKRYMEQQNRPYSVNDVFLNLHKEIGKTAVQKALDHLTAEGAIREKSYGKQKVYVFSQDKFPALDETQLREMDKETTQLNTNLKEKEKHLHETDTQLKHLLSTPTTQEAVTKATQIEEEVSRLQQKLTDLTENQVLVSKEERDKVLKENDNMSKQWRKRRRMAMDILDAILEGYPHPKAHLYEEVGIETDQEAGVTLPKI